MAWIGIRASVSKILATPGSVGGRPLVQINVKGIFPIQAAGISSTALRDKKDRPEPFPYKTKKYNLWRAWLQDTTTWRFDENTKVVVVEGPVAAGKTAFAKSLAEDLDMKHFPEPTMDALYINDYGYDLRQIDPQVPPSTRSFDEKDFCKDPTNRLTARFQIQKYIIRFNQYVDALAHLLNSGQGVVLERCAYSDYVFVETMHKAGYMSKGARDVYYDVRNNSIGELMKPHLVVYLDVPVPVIQQRIKERNIPHEVSSKVFTKEYLSNMEYFYKQRYLKDISTHAELLVYDWSEYGDVEVVSEDIERIDFDHFDKHHPKMKDWRMPDEWAWNNKRMLYSNELHELHSNFNVPRFDVPELVTEANDAYEWRKVWDNAPGMKYEKEFNPDMGDKDLLFKRKPKVVR